MRSKKELWLLLAFFLLPIALGKAFFYWYPAAFTSNTINYGKIINPLITTKKQDVRFESKTASLQGLWTLAYTAKTCGNTCTKALADMKTIRILTNDNMRRIQRILLIDGATNARQTGLLIAHPSIKLQQKLAKFEPNTIFLIDPLGNIMLHYAGKNINIKRVLKDLNRLLKYSRIG
ncbi:MAG: hypothetical protein FXV79_01490 [Candidatus Thioglobus sp.]|nr:MAG: hypothetical protein FXV79_01490 [Candidatus Thioglobus sp.]